MSGSSALFDTDLLRRRKDRAAPGIASHDFLLRQVTEDFAERLLLFRRTFARAANIGAWNGHLSRRLFGVSGISSMADLEDSPRLLEFCGPDRLETTLERLPLEEASLDLAVSALSLQLVNDLPGVLAQIRRALKPDGLFLAALLGADTLKELRQSWLEAELEVHEGASPRVAPFVDVRDMGTLLQRAAFALPVVDSDRLTVTYSDPLALMREIKAFGASNMLADRSRRPVTRRLLLRTAQIYQDRFGLPDGRIPATFEILTLTAWSPHESQQRPLKPGSARQRLAHALGVKEHKT